MTDQGQPPDLQTRTEGGTLDMLGRRAGMVIRLRLKATPGQGRIRNSEFGTRRRLRKRIKPHPKEEAMSRPQVTVRRVGRRPTAIRISAQPHRSLGSLRSLGMTGVGSLEKTCHPERGRPTAQYSVILSEAVRRPSREIPSYRRVLAIRPISGFGGSLVSLSSLGMTGVGSASLTTPKRTCLPNRSDSDREPRSGDRYLAWGVSPRNRVKKNKKSPGGATDQRDAKKCRRDACTTKAMARLWCGRPACTPVIHHD